MKQGRSILKNIDKYIVNSLYLEGSVNDVFLDEMILVDEISLPYLYGSDFKIDENIKSHKLFEFSKQFKKDNILDTIKEVHSFVYSLVKKTRDNLPKELIIGGREESIIKRGSFIQVDISRVSCVLLMCLGIYARIVNIFDIDKYTQTTCVEIIYDNNYEVIQFCEEYPQEVIKFSIKTNYEAFKFFGFKMIITINEYNPMDVKNDYSENIIDNYIQMLNFEKSNFESKRIKKHRSIEQLFKKYLDMNPYCNSAQLLVNNFFKMTKLTVNSDSDNLLFELYKKDDIIKLSFVRQLERDSQYYQITLLLNYKGCGIDIKPTTIWISSDDELKQIKKMSSDIINHYEYIDYDIMVNEVE
jgi:hypothetical protein